MPSANRTADTSLVFHCPGCGAAAVTGRYYELHWSWMGFSLGQERYLRCPMCDGEFLLQSSAPPVQQISGEDWTEFLIPPSSAWGVFLASLAIFLLWVPLLGFWLARRAYLANAQTHGLPKLFSISALIMSGLFTGGFVMAAVLVPLFLLMFGGK